MASWVVIPCLLTLRDEFNSRNPNRDKGADGTIGDSSHTSSSDHTPDEDSIKLRDSDADSINEVHALDIDSTGPWPGTNFNTLVMRVIDGERRKWRDLNDKCRLNYVIWNGKIYDKDNDFQPESYGGDDPHTNHAHFSGRYETSCENDKRPWGVKEEPMVTQFNAEDKAELRDAVDQACALSTWPSGGGLQSKVGNGVLNAGWPLTPGANRTANWANLQAIYGKANAAAEDAQDAKDNAAAVAAAVATLQSTLAFLGVDVSDPGWDPDTDPIVQRVRYAIAHPTP